MSGSPATIHVAFGAQEVTIQSNDPAVLQSLEASFRHMRRTGAASVVGAVHVRLEDGVYRGDGPVGSYEAGPSLRAAIRWARYQAIEALIRARTDLLWLHGAVAGWRGRALVMPGRRGRGKSTMVTELCRRGWTFLTDDILPLDPATLHVLPFPQVPEIRRDPGREMPEAWLAAVAKTEVALDARVGREALPVEAIVLPAARRTGGVTLRPCSPAEAVLEIAQGCWNFAEHGARAVGILSRLVIGLPTMRLTFHAGRAAAARVSEWAAETWPRGGQ